MIETVTKDLPTAVDEKGNPKTILVTGATGYVGGRLIRELLSHDYNVRVLVRNAKRLVDYSWRQSVEVIEGDANDQEVLAKAMQGTHIAYYLLHALNSKFDFVSEERELANNFGRACKENGVERIIYLGGLAKADSPLSAHLGARQETGQILRRSGVPTVELRAGIVLGSGSASFEMLRNLTERLPVMITPKWVNNRIQPIAIRDVLRYLVGSCDLPSEINRSFDIGGPDILTFKEMMIQFAEEAGLPKRRVFPIPVMTPKLASGWIGLVTPVPVTLAKRLVSSLKNEVLCNENDIRDYIPEPKEGLTGFRKAVGLALRRIVDADVETRWTNASDPRIPSDPLPNDPEWAGGSLYEDKRVMLSKDSIDDIWARVESVGGKNGYSGGTFLWEIRGLMDKVVGGVGLRRGRRDDNFLVEGEALDFWRVEILERPRLLRLRAEMKLPGKAWLQWELFDQGDDVLVVQKAIYAPRGLFGHVYWWMVAPMHSFVFPSMLSKIAGNNATKQKTDVLETVAS
ncbi:MAG: SDR family oxidoreductase [Microbacteriaceae bacterium]|nr:SDR family oxidoreductase [Microbacteriaceae bacterium]